MKCPKCKKEGYEPPAIGRPRKVDDKIVGYLYLTKGFSISRIACKLDVTRSAIQYSLRRSGLK